VNNENDGIPEAVYLPQVIEDYKGNPFIEALPPILSLAESVDALTMTPGYNETERELDVHYRFHCVQRLFRYFQPLDTHLDIEQRISRAIRQGYVSRNPLGPQYVRRLRQCSEATKARSLDKVDFRNVKSTASGFTIIGMSGVGKTTAVERVLSLYPRCITHVQYDGQPFYLKQITWMKLDCPFDGSIKGLCMSFFAEADRILDSAYSKRFLPSTTTVDAMIPKMAHIAGTHGIGLLVIDEIQHLNMAKSGGSEKMLNFFVTLVNTIGIPVLLIGTTKAMSILQSEFRQARRGSGQGDLLWDRMQNDTSWRIMLQSMWEYQWTRTRCHLTAEMEKTLYDESQGIIDIAVKLYALAQIKAIADATETVTPASIREVAAEKLRLVKPMLDALRSGDKKKLLQYEDIRPIGVEDYIAAQASKLGTYTQKVSTLEGQAVLKLLEMDISSKTARDCVKKVLAKSIDGQPLSGVVRKAFKMALNIETQSPDTGRKADIAKEDLRGAGGYDGLKESGVIATDEEW
jgi:hypothetical protein